MPEELEKADQIGGVSLSRDEESLAELREVIVRSPSRSDRSGPRPGEHAAVDDGRSALDALPERLRRRGGTRRFASAGTARSTRPASPSHHRFTHRPQRPKAAAMRPSLFTIDLPGPGRLSTMARPRGLDWLEDEMSGLRNVGVDVLVCALTPPELGELGLTSEARAAADAGLRFVALPIPDRTVPDLASVLPTLRDLAGQLSAGAHVVTHCRAGIGRASLLAASLLILNGMAPDPAWTSIEHARGLSVPDTDEQREWTLKLLAHAAS